MACAQCRHTECGPVLMAREAPCRSGQVPRESSRRRLRVIVQMFRWGPLGAEGSITRPCWKTSASAASTSAAAYIMA